MRKRYEYRKPTADEVKAHWLSQEPSVFRKPRSREKGVSIVTSKKQLAAILKGELHGEPQPVFKTKTPASVEPFKDPLKRVTSMIQMKTQCGVTSDVFYQQCESAEDLLLHELLYGEMSAAQRANALLKLADQGFRRQQEVLKQINIEKAREDKKAARLLKVRQSLVAAAKEDDE